MVGRGAGPATANFCMKPGRAILIYAAAVILLGALFAPWLFWLVQATGVEALTRHPFRRVFNRSVMIVALVGLWPLVRALGIRSWSALGYPPRRGWWREIVIGAALAMGSLGVAFVLTGRSLDWENSKYTVTGALLSVAATAVVVSLIEETFFRGAIQGALQQAWRWPVALVVASVIYSALHFLKPKGAHIAPEAVTWWSGFDCLGQVVTASLLDEKVGVAFVSLLLVGLIVGWTFQRTGALYWALGLHGGWVVANEFVRKFRGGNLVQDPVAWVVLLITWAVVAWLCRKSPTA